MCTQPTDVQGEAPGPPSQAARALFEGLIDYAGLYPPASLDAETTANNYARYIHGEHAWMLGRLVWPASKLAELTRIAGPLMPGTLGTSGYREHASSIPAWRISVVADTPARECSDAIVRFNEVHEKEDRGLAVADCLEIKVAAPGEIDAVIDNTPEGLHLFFEFPLAGDTRGYFTALSGTGASAKIRTGGVTANAFPDASTVARFIDSCRLAEVSFKATAGLHHAVRGEYRLTYEPASPCGTMFGFMNVFTAGVARASARLQASDLEPILAESDRGAFRVANSTLNWRDKALDASQIAHAREGFCLSYGSCSFDEPVDELRALKMI